MVQGQDENPATGPVDADLARQHDQLVVIGKVNDLVQANASMFTGVWTEDSARLTVGTVADLPPSPVLEQIRELADSVGMSLTVVQQARSLEQLRNVAEAVRPDKEPRLLGSDVGGTELDLRNNVLVVYTSGDVTEVRQRARRRFADAVRIEPAPEVSEAVRAVVRRTDG